MECLGPGGPVAVTLPLTLRKDYSSLVTEESPNQVAIWSVTVKRLGSTCPFEWKHLLGEQSLFLLWNPPG